jgi:hypothetical protein
MNRRIEITKNQYHQSLLNKLLDYEDIDLLEPYEKLSIDEYTAQLLPVEEFDVDLNASYIVSFSADSILEFHLNSNKEILAIYLAN